MRVSLKAEFGRRIVLVCGPFTAQRTALAVKGPRDRRG